MRLLGIGCRSRSGKGLDSPSLFPVGTKGSPERRLNLIRRLRAGQQQKRWLKNGESAELLARETVFIDVIDQHRPRAGSGEVNIQCIRVGPLADRISPE